jgi:hypothetical protein
MTTPAVVDLTSDLVDLSEIPLDELRNMDDPVIAVAIQRMYQNAAKTAGDEVQDQRG